MTDFRRNERIAHRNAVDIATSTPKPCVDVGAAHKSRGHGLDGRRRLFLSG
jgi:hypothetical protein